MRKILLIGAGRSSSYLIKYFLDHASKENWSLTVADVSEDAAKSRIGNHPAATGIGFDINNEEQRRRRIGEADLVVSMLPANMHFPVALECLRQKKSLVTASYVSQEMQEINNEVTAAGLLFMNECGLDPGIDHMSAMEVIDDIHSKGGSIHSFRSYTGGLVAPESNDNPWGYKFSWNPRNVILAGQGTAKYIENGNYKYIPYNRLFMDIQKISVDDQGEYDGYANRDSLSYRKLYNLENIPTMIRGTLRQSGYCSAWNVFVRLGLTDDTYIIEDSANLTYRKLVDAFLPNLLKGNTTEEHLADFIGLPLTSPEMQMILWTGIVQEDKIGLPKATPAQILQQLLEQKWKLKESDRDLIVMQHIFEYTLRGKNIFHTASLVVKGENSVYTAMAKTVGTPLAIVAKNILNGVIKLKGVCIPTDSSVYKPVLEELKSYGVSFIEKQKELV
jgi:saccharopine dehydrogenase-like NADP-dependent oxidoreductase